MTNFSSKTLLVKLKKTLYLFFKTNFDIDSSLTVLCNDNKSWNNIL